MKPLLLALSLLLHPTPQRCTTSCFHGARDMFSGTICYYDEEISCPRTRPPCIDTESILCVPRVVDLGLWNCCGAEASPTYHYNY